MPSVTAVIATRDRPELLRKALRAVFAQDYSGSIDAVVVYDQSPPDPQLSVDFAEYPLTIIENTHTPGLAGARNSGVEAATGDWIALCDDDDEWMPDKLRAQFESRAGDEGIGVMATGILVTYEDQEFLRVPTAERLTKQDLLGSRVFAAHPSSIVVHRRTMIDDVGLVDEEIPGSYGEDYEWILRAVGVTEIAVVTRPLVLVRWHRGSYFADRWRTIDAAIDYMLEREPAFYDYPDGLAYMYGRQAFALAAAGDGSDARRKAIKTIRTNWKERRAYLAIAVSLHLVSADRLMGWAHSRGKGI
jgi:glycosyltransferase involved in cell wall biosynthesis